MSNGKALIHIKKKWWLYLIWLLVVAVVSASVYTVASEPEGADKLVIFSATYGDEESQINYFKKLKPDYVKKVEVTAMAKTDNYFDSVFSASYVYFFGGCTINKYALADVVIIPESVADGLFSNGDPGDWLELDDIAVRSAFGETGKEITYYEKSGKLFGIKIFDKEDEDDKSPFKFTDGKGNKENFYALFRKNSLHLGSLSELSENKKHDGAITIVKELLSL